jgi:predicted transcriptional regulator
MVAVAAAPVRAVEIEVAGPDATQLSFRPIRRAVRGRADFALAKSKSALALRDVWPEPIPGQVLGIAEDGTKYLREPLYDKEHAKVAQRIKNKGLVLPEERETFASETVITWAYWMRRAVDAGLARIIKGELPPIEELEPPRKKPPRDERLPRKSFILDEPGDSPSDRLAEAIERLAENTAQQTAVMNQLLAKLANK